MVIIATMMKVPTKYLIISIIRSSTPATECPAAANLINPKIPLIIPNISATEAIATDAATTGMDLISCTFPAGANINLTPPTFGMR